MNNVLAMLRLARTHDIRVVIALAWLPENYASRVGPIASSANIGGANAYFMHQPRIDAFDRAVPLRATALAASNLDYIDIHAYPMGSSYDMAKDFSSAEVSRIPKAKPLVMGEFGAFKSAYPELADAVSALRRHQRESCRFAFNGWLLWTLDSHEQPGIWNALDGGGAINKALAPIGNPSPCVGIRPTAR